MLDDEQELFPLEIDQLQVYVESQLGFELFPGRGPVPADYMVLGTSPSLSRLQERWFEPFGSKAYGLISKLSRDFSSMYVTNLVKSPIPRGKKKIAQSTLRGAIPSLMLEIEMVRPKRILAMGSIPAHALCPAMSDLNQDHGTFFTYNYLGGQAYVVPTFQFTSAARNPSLWKMVLRDLERFFTLPDPEFSPYTLISSPDEMDLLPGDEVYLDLETTGLQMTDRITQLGLRPARTGINYIVKHETEFGQSYEDFLNIIIEIGRRFKTLRIVTIGHNMQFDVGVLLRETAMSWPRLACLDTMNHAHIMGEQVLSLKHLTTMYSDLPGSRFGGTTTDPTYLAEDLRSTEAVREHFRAAESRYITGVVDELVPVIAAMKVRGVYIDAKSIDSTEAVVEPRIAELSAAVAELNDGVALNINSPRQVVAFLIRQGIHLTEKTKAGAYSAKESVLLSLVDQYEDSSHALKMLMEFRLMSKLKSGFITPYRLLLQYDGKLHPNLLLHGTSTGRLSCKNPNLQAVTREGPLKLAFVSRWDGGEYCLIDLSQAELRVGCLLSNDRKLLSALNSEDVHRQIASMVFQKPPEDVTSAERKASKKITFGVFYGGSVQGLAARANLEEHVVAEVLEMFNQQFSGLSSWLKRQKKLASTVGIIETPLGRLRDLRDLVETEGEVGAGRKAVNTPNQSTASDIMLFILNRVEKYIRQNKMKSRPLFGVHDSLLFECYLGEREMLRKGIQQAFRDLRTTPLNKLPLFAELPMIGEVVFGPSWAAVESTNENYAPTAQYACSSHSNADDEDQR